MHHSFDSNRPLRAWTVRLLPLLGALLLATLLVSAMRLTGEDAQAGAPARPVAQGTVGVTRYISTTGVDSGGCTTRFSACRTLQYAVDRAGAGDTIRIARGLYSGVVNRSGGNQMARIPVSVTIAGGYDPLNFDGAPNPVLNPVIFNLLGSGRGLVIANGAVVTVRDLSMSGGSGTAGGGDGNGGAILVTNAGLTLNNVAVTNNSAANGGAIALFGGTANLLGVTLTNNQATADGGALHLAGPAAGSSIQIDPLSLLELNSAANNGGAIAIANGSATVTGAPLRNNTATASGGALYLAAGTATLNGVTVQANTAGADGGAAALSGGQLRANANSLVTLNTANNGRGSAFFANNAQIFVNGSTVTVQTGQGNGGVVYLQESTLNLTNNSIFSLNSTTGEGTIFAESNSTVLLDGVTAQGNRAASGALVRADGGQVTVRNSQIADNTATADGGALALTTATLVLENSTFTANLADGNGGAFTLANGTLQVSGSTLTQNRALGDGGAAHVLTSTVTLADSDWLSNQAEGSGGAIYALGSSGSGGGGRFEQNRTLTEGSGGAIFWEGPSLTFDRVVAFTGNLAGVTITARARSAAAGNPVADEIAAAFAPQWLSLEELTARGLIRDGRIELTPDSVSAVPGMGMGEILALLQQPMPSGVGQLPGAAESVAVAPNLAATPRGRSTATASSVITTEVITKSGGAIYGRNIALSLTAPTFTGNQADVAGGALFVEGGTFTLTNATVSDNRSFRGPGGGVYLNKISGSIENSTFSANQGSNGGGVYAVGGQIRFATNTLNTNRADIDGGGVFLLGGTHTVSDSTFEANIGDRGGGLYLDGGSMTVTRNTIQDNETSFVRTQARGAEAGIGVGAYVSGTKELSFTHNVVQRNKIPFLQYMRINGILTETKVITVVDPPIIKCITPADPTCIITETITIADNGGGLYLKDAEGLVADSIFRENEASRSGGAMVMDGGKVTLIDNLMVRNSIGVSSGLGSAIFMSGTKASLLHNTIADNIHQNLSGDGRNVAVYYAAKGDGLVLTNNIFANHEVGVGGSDGAEAVESSNVWWNHSERHWTEELFTDLSPIFGDPAFKNAAGGDYSILRSSAGYNRGVDLPDIGAEFALIDLAGDRRLKPVDAGAYEANYNRGLNLFHTSNNLNLAKDVETSYAITVLNNSKASVAGITFQYALPPEQQALAISSNRGGCNLGSLSCNLGTLNIGEQAVVTVRARAVVEAIPGQIKEMQSTATVNFAGLNPSDSDQSLPITTFLQALVLGEIASSRDGTPTHTGACAVKLVTEDRGTSFWPSVQDAVNRVLLGSDRILVSGTCLGSVSLVNNKNMLIQGGWSTDFTAHNPVLYPTTLRATSGTVVRVLNEGIEPRIYDVTITGGNAARGGGVYVLNASPVFSNVIVLGNRAGTQGGGIFVDVGSKPIFVDSTIENNIAPVAGAGVYVNVGSGEFKNVIVRANTGATDGGGFYLSASDAQVSGGEIRNHSVSGYGGGVYMTGSRAQVSNMLIQNNSAGASGGGIYAFKSPATIQFNRIIENRTSAGEMNFIPFIFDLALVERRGGGGGIYSEAGDIRILNNYIAKNSAGASSGHVGVGIHMWLFDAAEVSGNMIVDNQGNGVYMRQKRSIFKFFILLPPLMPPPFSPELILPLATPPPAKLYHNTIARNSGVGVYGYSQTNLEMANNLITQNSGGGIRIGEEIIPHLIVIIIPGFGFFIPIPIIYPTFYPPEAAADFTFWGQSPSFSKSGAFTDGSQSNDFAGEDPGFQDPDNGNYHLKRTSLAFQNAKASGLGQDIDGDERKQGLKPDIGADEYSFRRTRYATVGGTDAAGSHLCLNWKQPCTLQTAIDSAEDGDLIKVAGYNDGRTYSTIINRNGHNTVAIVRKNVTIQGGYCETTTAQSGVMQCDWERPHPETYKTVLNAGGAGRGLTIETDKGMEIFNVHITGGNATLGGGLYVISSTAVLSNVEIFGNQATRGGGAYFVSSKAVMVNSQVHDNSAAQGGGLYMDSASEATFHQSSLTGNQADEGGAVFANSSKSKILDNVIAGNRANKDGGAFYLLDSTISVERNRVESNSAQRGGGFFLATGEPSVISNTLTLNQAALDGGGFYIVGSAGLLQENIVTTNSANGQTPGTGRGGGAYLENTQVNFKENQVQGNSARTGGGLHLFAASEAIIGGNRVDNNVAALDGGGFHLDASAAILTDNSVTGNRGRNGGGFYLFNFSSAQLGNTIVLSNTATEDGGGLYFRLSNATLNTALIRANRARTGGAIFAKLSKLALSELHAESNQASTLGGAIYLDESDSTLFDSNIYSNTATLDGGGVYVLRSGGAIVQGIDAQGNQAGGNGGAIFLNDSNIGVNGRRLAGNRAVGNGGGLYADKSDITFEGFLVRGNQAINGAGIFLSNGSDAAFSANAFVDNIATGRGGALAMLGSSPTFVQTTFARNQGGEAIFLDLFGPVTSRASFLNTLFADQPVALSLTEKTSATLSVNLWHNVATRWNGPAVPSLGETNIEGDPLFAADGYHLTKDSPAINEGAKTTASKDIDGESIPQAGVPDIGADEFPVPCAAQIERNPSRTYTSIQAAVDDAETGDLIKVAGVCREVTQRNGVRQVLYLNKNVTLRGGYNPDNWTASLPITQVTSIQPISTARSIYISGGVEPIIENLTIQGGNGSGQGGGPDGQDAGSNLFIVDASPVFSNTIIRDGGSVVYGGAGFLLRSDARFITNTVTTNNAVAGGAFFLLDSTATFEDNFFERNGASKDGGAFFLTSSTAQIQGNTFKQNSAGTAGGAIFADASAATVTGNHFDQNRAGSAGAIYVDFSPAQIIRNRFTGNEAQSAGGVMIAYSEALFDGNYLFENSALNGGAVYVEAGNAQIINNVMVSNTVSSSGSGVYVLSASPQLTHNTLVFNNGGDGSAISVQATGGAQSVVPLLNNIIAFHELGVFVLDGGSVNANGTLWFNNETDAGTAPTNPSGFSEGSLRVTSDPLFVDLANNDFRLTTDSPAREAALASNVDHDWQGDPRPTDLAPDIGADEYYLPQMLLSAVASPNPLVAGRPGFITFQIANIGNVALSARVTATLPAALGGNNVQVWTASIPVGQTWAESVALQIPADLQGEVAYTLDVTTSQRAADRIAGTFSVTPPNFGLVTTIARNPETVILQRPVRYEITADNTGNQALPLFITATLPSQVTPGGVVTWTVNLAAGARWRETITVTPTTVLPSAELTVRIDIATADGSVSVTENDTTVIGLSGYVLAQTVTPDPPLMGQPFTITAHVTNTGSVRLQTALTMTLQPNFVGEPLTTQRGIDPGQAATQQIALPANSYLGPLTSTLLLAVDGALVEESAFAMTAILAPLGPTIIAVNSGPWNDPNTWQPQRLPNAEDIVGVLPGRTVQLVGPVTVAGVQNNGVILGPPDAAVGIFASQEIQNFGEIRATSGAPGRNVELTAKTIYNEGTIVAGDGDDDPQGRGHDGGSVTVNTALLNNQGVIRAGNGGAGASDGGSGGAVNVTISSPTGELLNDGEIRGGNGGAGTSGAGGAGGPIAVTGPGAATPPLADGGGDVIVTGVMQAGNGGNGATAGGDGGGVRLDVGVSADPATPPGGTVSVSEGGVVRGGDGGNVTGSGNGGAGGPADAIGLTVDVAGTLRGGNGGNAAGTAIGNSGDGGAVTAIGGAGGPGAVKVRGDGVNNGVVSGGDGGNGNPAAGAAQNGGNGGDATLMASPTIDVNNGQVNGGNGGVGTGGGANGSAGDVVIGGGDGNTADTPLILISGAQTEIAGQDVTIFGGDGLLLKLLGLGAGGINANGILILAVGDAGQIDLSGNGAVIFASGQIRLFVNGGGLLLDNGVNLNNLGSSTPSVGGARILYLVRLLTPSSLLVRPGEVVLVPVVVTNLAPVPDSYQLLSAGRSVALAPQWTLSTLPPLVPVQGTATARTVLTVTVPATATVGTAQRVDVTAISFSDAQSNALGGTQLIVSGDPLSALYLPIIGSRQPTPIRELETQIDLFLPWVGKE